MIEPESKLSRQRQERLLDEALAATFPASDPVVAPFAGREAARSAKRERATPDRPPGHD
jgi:hypothetical protein